LCGECRLQFIALNVIRGRVPCGRAVVDPLAIAALFAVVISLECARSIHVLTLRDKTIFALTAFELPIGPQLFQAFELPLIHPGDRGAK
jgi:hypothetical protein